MRSDGWLSTSRKLYDKEIINMGLFGALLDAVSMPARVAVDVVKLPIQLMEGDDLFQNTSKGIEKIEDDLDN